VSIYLTTLGVLPLILVFYIAWYLFYLQKSGILSLIRFPFLSFPFVFLVFGFDLSLVIVLLATLLVLHFGLHYSLVLHLTEGLCYSQTALFLWFSSRFPL